MGAPSAALAVPMSMPVSIRVFQPGHRLSHQMSGDPTTELRLLKTPSPFLSLLLAVLISGPRAEKPRGHGSEGVSGKREHIFRGQDEKIKEKKIGGWKWVEMVKGKIKNNFQVEDE